VRQLNMSGGVTDPASGIRCHAAVILGSLLLCGAMRERADATRLAIVTRTVPVPGIHVAGNQEGHGGTTASIRREPGGQE
jgi:hypothetical protein